jgi:hypothetical protein
LHQVLMAGRFWMCGTSARPNGFQVANIICDSVSTRPFNTTIPA